MNSNRSFNSSLENFSLYSSICEVMTNWRMTGICCLSLP